MKQTKIGVDFGGQYLRIYTKDNGLIFKQPALIAVKKHGSNFSILATGKFALQYKQTPQQDVLVFSPISEGEVKSVEYATLLLKKALKEIEYSLSNSKIKAIVSIPSSLNDEQKRNYIRICKNAGIKQLDIVDAPICALLGTQYFSPDDEIAVVDIGATKCDFEVLKNFQIQKNATLGLGGNSITRAIIESLWADEQFLISEQSAENLHKELASLFENDKRKFSVEGTDLINQTFVQKTFSNAEIFPIIKVFFDEIVLTLATLQNEYGREFQNIFITGGLGKVAGLQSYLAQKFPNSKICIEFDTDQNILNGFEKILKN